VVRLLFFLINLIAVYLLLRGHYLPGGGFIGGLATAISLILLSLGIGLEELHRIIRLDPVRLASSGLAIALLTSLAPVLSGHAFLQHFELHLNKLPLLGELHLSTTLLFDIGVYLVVVGTIAKIIFVLGKSTQGLRALVAEEEARYSSILEQPIEGGDIGIGPDSASEIPSHSPGASHSGVESTHKGTNPDNAPSMGSVETDANLLQKNSDAT
jgi:multisubunit Na+/H+ antiporter MnhB subunit